MRSDHRAAIAASDQLGRMKFEVSSSQSLRGLTSSSRGYCHIYLSPYLLHTQREL
jgi:hypothetical protein